MDPTVARPHDFAARPTVMGLTASALVAVTLLVPGHARVDPLAWAVVGLAAALSLAGTSETGRRLWRRVGVVVASVLIALLVATTGGAASIYQDLFVVLVVASAVIKPTRELLVDIVAMLLAAATPLLYGGDASQAFVSDLVVDAAIWVGVAATARILSVQYAGARSHLAQREQQFRLLAGDVPAIVYRQTLERRPRITWMSERTASITGFPAQAFLDDPDLASSRVPNGDAEAFRSVRQSLLAGESGVVRYRFDRADGERIWLEDHYAPVTDGEGRVVASQGVAFDASARVAAEQALADAHEHDRLARHELGRLLAAQRAFVQNISHELRTPLTSVVGFADVLERTGADMDPATRAHLTARLSANAKRLRALVEDLVDVDRLISDSDPTLEAVPTDVGALLEDTITLVAEHRHTIGVEGPELVATLDPSVVRRLARHLVDNAVRHTPLGTHVTCRYEQQGPHLLLVVEDDGPGVPEHLRPRLFEPFVQGEHASRDPNPGTGVGLALAARLAQAHGGRLWHEVPPERGARFCALLRIA